MELVGVVKKIVNNSYGYIESDDDEYYFDKSDLISNFDLQLGLKVFFKPIIINNIKKAILIEKIVD